MEGMKSQLTTLTSNKLFPLSLANAVKHVLKLATCWTLSISYALSQYSYLFLTAILILTTLQVSEIRF